MRQDATVGIIRTRVAQSESCNVKQGGVYAHMNRSRLIDTTTKKVIKLELNCIA